MVGFQGFSIFALSIITNNKYITNMLDETIPKLKISKPKMKVDVASTLRDIPKGKTRRYSLNDIRENTIRTVAGTFARREGKKMYTVNVHPNGLVDVTRLE